MAFPTSPFPTILNFRDIGMSINGLQTAATEHIQQRKQYDAQVFHPRGADLDSAGFIAPMKIPDIRKLIALMAMGRRTEAIFILGSEIIQPRGLLGQAKDAIDSSVRELKQILEILAEAENHPVLFHCTSGKDRTGLVAFMLLLILDIPLDAISADYQASESELVTEKETRIQELRVMGLSADFADCSPNWVVDVHKHIIETYGSVPGYLDCIGFDESLRSKVKSNLLENKTAKP
ncbi:MAG: hypothetical protein Q9193_000800 [Seirophora villosa]